MGTTNRIPRDRFFAGMAMLALGAAIIGFSKTFFLPLAQGRFHPLPAAYFHAAFLFGWVALFLVQTVLVRARAIRWHRRVGAFGAILALGVAASTIAMGIQSVHRDVAAGGGETAISNVAGVFTAMLAFLLLVGLAIAWRKRPDYHARLMLLATLHVVWPAWFRFRHFFPSVPFPEIWFAVVLADAWIVLAMAHDRMKLGHIHPVLLWGGLGVIAEHVAEAVFYDSRGWRVLAHWLMALFA